MKITVVGAGAVGSALMGRLAERHEVTLGARDMGSEKTVAALAALGGKVGCDTIPQAVGNADVTILAVPGAGVPAFIEEHDALLSGALVIDASNDRSGGEGSPLHHIADWQRLAPDAVVARAFCTLGWENFADPEYDGVAATLLWCGPDGEHGQTITDLIAGMGLDPVRIGGVEAADVLDGVTRLWFQLAFTQGMGRRTAYRLLSDTRN